MSYVVWHFIQFLDEFFIFIGNGNRDSESELQLSESGESLVKESRASDTESDSPLLDDRESMTKIDMIVKV